MSLPELLALAWAAVNAGLLGGALLAYVTGRGRERRIEYGPDWRDAA